MVAHEVARRDRHANHEQVQALNHRVCSNVDELPDGCASAGLRPLFEGLTKLLVKGGELGSHPACMGPMFRHEGLSGTMVVLESGLDDFVSRKHSAFLVILVAA